MASTEPQAGHATDEQRLAELGYKQELSRAWSSFTNFAISFTIISVLAGCFTHFSFAWNAGGPALPGAARRTGPRRRTVLWSAGGRSDR